MTMDARFKSYHKSTPGPGDYSLKTLISDGPKFTTRIKPVIDPHKCQNKVGPADYDPKPLEKSLIYSMRPKLSPVRDDKSPGPGSYNDNRQSHYENLSGSIIGLDPRKSFFL